MSLDVLMDPVTRDLPDFTRHGTGPEVIAQRIRARLTTHLHDWKLDKDSGIDWIAILAMKPTDPESLATTLAVEVKGTPGVVGVSDLTWEQVGRLITITMTVFAEEGDTLTVVATPFGVDGNPSVTVMVAGHAGPVAPR